MIYKWIFWKRVLHSCLHQYTGLSGGYTLFTSLLFQQTPPSWPFFFTPVSPLSISDQDSNIPRYGGLFCAESHKCSSNLHIFSGLLCFLTVHFIPLFHSKKFYRLYLPLILRFFSCSRLYPALLAIFNLKEFISMACRPAVREQFHSCPSFQRCIFFRVECLQLDKNLLHCILLLFVSGDSDI
jgi:hypothetical protein